MALSGTGCAFLRIWTSVARTGPEKTSMRYEQVIDLLTEAGEARNLANSAGHTQAARDLRRYAAELEYHADPDGFGRNLI